MRMRGEEWARDKNAIFTCLQTYHCDHVNQINHGHHGHHINRL